MYAMFLNAISTDFRRTSNKQLQFQLQSTTASTLESPQ